MIRAAIGGQEAASLFSPLSRFKTLVLAVSGGPDSLALLVLARDWALALRSPPELFSVTVDHGLRPQSRAEAEAAGRLSSQHGILHTILIWAEPKPATGISNAAREARYALLGKFAQEVGPQGPTAIVTAHHQDDQAETFLMRLARGAGVDGLSAMASERPLFAGSSVTLARPFLSVPKARLVATLQARGIDWFEDPGNANTASERTRVRHMLATLAREGLSADAVTRSAGRIGQAREALDYAAALVKKESNLIEHAGLYSVCDRATLKAAPSILQVRMVADLISRFGGATPAPTLSEIEDAAARIRQRPCKFTLGGAVVSAGQRRVRVWREAGRISDAPLALQAGECALWDNRFWVSAGASLTGNVEVRPLGEAALRTLGELSNTPIEAPAGALEAVPAFYLRDKLLAVPPLGVYRDAPSLDAAMAEKTVFALPAR